MTDAADAEGYIYPAPNWDVAALEKLSPADQIDYITDRLTADFKNKTPNVAIAILMLQNVAEELRGAGA